MTDHSGLTEMLSPRLLWKQTLWVSPTSHCFFPSKEATYRDFPGGPVAKTPRSPYKNQIPHVTTKSLHVSNEDPLCQQPRPGAAK